SAAGDWNARGRGGSDGEVRLWDLRTGRCLETLREDDDLVFSVVFSPDGKTLASGGWDQSIRLWDVRTGGLRVTCRGLHEGPVRSLAFHPDGRTVVSASFDRTIRFWDAHTGL